MGADLQPPRVAVEDAVRRALTEDLMPLGDLTALLLPDDLQATAQFVSRDHGVLAGAACADETFRQLDASVAREWVLEDGDDLVPGAVIATVRGRLQSIVTAERTALNFLGHLSGIASLTRRYVDKAGSQGAARVWDTRKTTPGLRSLEKAAVRAGGGANHRGNLSDWILLKDNHIALMGIEGAVAAAKQRWPGRTVHVECDTLEQADEALAAGADALLLDNMSTSDVRVVVARTAEVVALGSRRPLLEVSGGVNLETVGGYAATGVDLISVGAITNSAPVVDIGLDIAS